MSYMTKEDLQTLGRIQTAKTQERDSRKLPVWKEIGALTNPEFNDWNDDPESATQKTARNIYDSTMQESGETLANGMMGSGFGRNFQWFKYGAEAEKFRKDEQTGKYLQECEDIRRRQFNNSNFYDEARLVVLSSAHFGTGIMVRDNNDEKQRQVYNTLHLKRCVILENEFHLIDSLFYTLWLDPFEAVAKFGLKNLPQAIQDAHRGKQTTLYKFITYIFPRDKFGFQSDMVRLTKNKPYAVVIVSDIDKEKSVYENGLSSQNFFVLRWAPSMDGLEWGDGYPGILALGAAKQVNALRRDYSKSSALNAEYPLKATKSLRGRINLYPKGVTHMDPGDDFAGVRVTGELQSQLADIMDFRQVIKDAYMTSIFLILTQNVERQKTATEVEGLQGERAALMGAYYGRVVCEYLEPVIEDGYQADMDMGLLPPRPEIAAGQLIKINMISPLALLQEKSAVLDPLDRYIAKAASLTQIQPNAMDKVDIDEYLDLAAEKTGVSKLVVRSRFAVEKMRTARAELQAKQAAAEMEQKKQESEANAYNKMTKGPEPGSPMAQRQETRQ